MKVALVSFGHTQDAFPLAKALSRNIDVELYLCLAQNRKTQGVVDLSRFELPTGIITGHSVFRYMGPEIESYVDGKFRVTLVIYSNLKLKSWQNLRISVQLSRSLRTYDLIHFNGQDGVLPHFMGLLPRKPKAFTIHDFIGHSGERNKKFPEQLNRFLLRSRSQVILQNAHDFSNVCRQFPSYRATLNCIPLAPYDIHAVFKPPAKNGDLESDLLFWGRISEYKGVEYLVDAARIVREKLPNLRVILAGSGNYYFDISPLKHDSTFTILDRYISNGELTELIRKTKLVVCPYKDATQSGVIMATFALGKPVVASAVAGLAEAVEDGVTGRLVPPCDVPALAEAISSSLQNPHKLQEMEANIRNLTKSGELSWNRVAERTMGVYLKAIGHRCR